MCEDQLARPFRLTVKDVGFAADSDRDEEPIGPRVQAKVDRLDVGPDFRVRVSIITSAHASSRLRKSPPL